MTVVTSRPSRAWVHSDCSVYIALPSACRLITGRSGHATAAPVATGMPNPIEPPVSVSQSCGGAPAVAGDAQIPPVCASSATIAPSGSSCAERGRERLAGERAGRPVGPHERCTDRGRTRGAERVGERARSRRRRRRRVGEHVDLAAVGHEIARLARVREERDRRAASRRARGGGGPRAARPRTRRGSRAARPPGCPHRARSRVGNTSPRTLAPVAAAIRLDGLRARPRRPRSRSPTQQRRRLAAAERLRDQLDRVARDARRPRRRRADGRGRRRSSHDTSAGEDQRRDRARRRERRGDRVGRVRPDGLAVRTGGGSSPRRSRRASRCRTSSGASSCWWYVACSPTMFTIGVLRAARVVQVRDPVAEAGPEVQQRRGRPAGHARVPVGRAGDDAFEQAEHRPHLGHGVERGDEVHLGGARVGEADVDAGVDERADAGPARRSCDRVPFASGVSRGGCRGSGCRAGRTRS